MTAAVAPIAASHFFVRLVNACLCARPAGETERSDRRDEYHKRRAEIWWKRVQPL